MQHKTINENAEMWKVMYKNIAFTNKQWNYINRVKKIQ